MIMQKATAELIKLHFFTTCCLFFAQLQGCLKYGDAVLQIVKTYFYPFFVRIPERETVAVISIAFP